MEKQEFIDQPTDLKGDALESLEAMVRVATAKISELKELNKKLKEEANEYKRLLALSEKKAERLNQELESRFNKGYEDWRDKERQIKDRIMMLAAKVAAFEKAYSKGG